MKLKALPYRQLSGKSSKPLYWIQLVVLTIATVWLLGSCENDIEKIKKLSTSEEIPAISAEGYEVLITDSTVVRQKLQTPEMIIHDNEKEPYTEFPRGVIITQYDNKMNTTSYITAQYAKYFKSDKRWEAKNNVVAINQQGDTLKTEYLVWDEKKAMIYSNQFVKIIRKNNQVTTGTSFESNQDFSVYLIKNLKGDFYVDVQDK